MHLGVVENASFAPPDLRPPSLPSYSLARLSAPRLGSIFARRRAFTRDAFAVFCSGTRAARRHLYFRDRGST